MRNTKWIGALFLFAVPLQLPAAEAPVPAVSGPVVQISPSVVNFGVVVVTHYKIEAVTVTNTGSSNLIIRGHQMYGNASVFGIDTDACAGTTLSPGGSCVVQLFFSPDSQLEGWTTAYYVLFDNASGGYQVVPMYGYQRVPE